MAGTLGVAVTYIFCHVCQWPPLPPLGQSVDNLDVFVAGETEADEPLTVEYPRCFLQQRNSPPIVLYQVVVGREDICDSSLLIQAGERHKSVWKVGKRDSVDRGTSDGDCIHFCPPTR